ncbi:hypothetical protein F8M41_004803 [Gigaspora margarita]|uniref:Uncharacterized protein n=1 Tax=Gigaspora margarita TaxID=4874 RepID=A0A8H3XAP3_GIGMA|nr:hypothetical protein F8M41_004803 [Gigaspora margarita]
MQTWFYKIFIVSKQCYIIVQSELEVLDNDNMNRIMVDESNDKVVVKAEGMYGTGYGFRMGKANEYKNFHGNSQDMAMKIMIDL